MVLAVAPVGPMLRTPVTAPPMLRAVATVLKRFWVAALPTIVPAWRLMLPVPAFMVTAEALALEPITTVLAPVPAYA